MKTLQLKQDFYWAGILDKNLRVFDIIMYTEFGTTYNSYILKAGDETILFETAKEKFFGDYRAAFFYHIDIALFVFFFFFIKLSYYLFSMGNPYGNQLSEKYRE